MALSANGRIKPDVVLFGDRKKRHPEGAYHISRYEGKRLIRLSVGKDATTAIARRLQKEAEINAVNNGVTVLPEESYLQEARFQVSYTTVAFRTACG